MEIILDSTFDEQVVQAVRRRLFDSLVGNLDQLCQGQQFAEARAKADAFLQLDPQYVPALCAVLRVCSEECRQSKAGGQNYEQRVQRLSGCAKQAEHRELLKLANEQRDLLASEALRDFYLEWADAEFDRALANKDRPSVRDPAYLQALRRIEQAVVHERCGQRARTMRHSICVAGALADINTEDTKCQLARQLIDAGLKAEPQDPHLTAVQAGYFLRQGDVDRCRAELAKAEQYNETSNDPNAASLINNIREVAEQMHAARSGRGGGAPGAAAEVMRLLKQAGEAMEAGNYSRALDCWTQLEAHVPHLPDEAVVMVYAQKAQCQLLTGNLNSARQSYRQAVRRTGPGLPPNLRSLLQQLSKFCE
jgi:hypothetical protein